MANPDLRTPRLWLRPLELADADQVQRLFPLIENVRYMSRQVPWPYPADGALTYYRDVALPAVERGDAWHWTLRLHEAPGQILGAIALFRGDADNRGFWIGPAWQGRRLATEACAAVNAFWFDVLAFPVMRVAKAIANEPSRRISVREGMRVVATEERDFVSGRLPAEIWELTAGAWRARAGARSSHDRQR